MEGNLYSTINGVEMIIDAAIWKAVTGIDMGWVCKFEESMDSYSKMETYRGMLLDPVRILRNQLGVVVEVKALFDVAVVVVAVVAVDSW